MNSTNVLVVNGSLLLQNKDAQRYQWLRQKMVCLFDDKGSAIMATKTGLDQIIDGEMNEDYQQAQPARGVKNVCKKFKIQ